MRRNYILITLRDQRVKGEKRSSYDIHLILMESPKEDRLEQINTQTNNRITTTNCSLKLYHIICDRA